MKKIFICFLLSLCFIVPSFAKIGAPTSDLNENKEALEKLQKKLDKKQQKEKKKKLKEEKRKKKEEAKRLAPRMVETKEEWLKEASSTDRIKRNFEKKQPDINNKLNPLEDPTAYFVKYNDPPGEREINLSSIKKNKFLHSQGVVTSDFKRLAYVEYSFNPEFNQISSELFVLPLNENDSRLERIKNPNLLLADREFTYSSGKTELRKNLMSAITIIDWKDDNSALLAKEKTGSLIEGIFRTNISVVYFDEEGLTIAYQVFSDLEQKIKKYWLENKKIHLNFYRWDIKPLGWSAENPEEIVALAYAFSKDNKKTYLGAWGVNYLTGDIRLLSLDNTTFNISTGALTVKYDIDR